MEKKQFDVTGMTCAACSARVEKCVGKLEGVRSVQVNLLAGSMTVCYDERATGVEAIEHSVEEAGYGAHVRREDEAASAAAGLERVRQEQLGMRRRWWWSLVFLVPLLYVAMGHMLGWPLPPFLAGDSRALALGLCQLALLLPIMVLNRRYYTVGFRTLFRGSPNMDSLVAMGSFAAFAYGVYAVVRIGVGTGAADWDTVRRFAHDLYFESAGTILTLVTLGKYFESKSKGKTSEAITKLMNLAPETAILVRFGMEKEVPVSEVRVGDLVRVKPGGRVPVDGVIEQGSGSVDESALTGESLPVFKQPGDAVLTATINRTGAFTLRATKVGRDTTLAHIIGLVNEAASSKAPISRLADRVSAVFVPVVIGIAVLATVVWLLLGRPFDFALSVGIAVLVISCPCALGLATPVAIMVGTGRAAECGILVKSAESFEKAKKIDTVVLDKTGTITEGRPQVTDVVSRALGREEVLAVLAALERPSEHPLAEAVLREAVRSGVPRLEADAFRVVPGLGVEGDVDGRHYRAGSLEFMRRCGADVAGYAADAEALAGRGRTPLFLADEGGVLGLVAVADVVRPSSREAIGQMRRAGMEVVMLTGDNRRTAEAIRSELGIPHVVAEVLPQDKDREVLRLQAGGRSVAMVGDGINDAPALTRADLGIAVGSGTDIAIESADMVLMKGDLRDAVTAFRLSRAVLRNIRENLFWAFIYNIVCIPLAAGVFYPLLGWKLSPMLAAAAMSFSSVSVVLNALRLRRFKPLVSR